MSGVPGLPHRWNRVAVKTERTESFSLKMSFVKFTIVFYILFMWIGVSTSGISWKWLAKETFDPLNYFDNSSPNTTFQSSKFCIQNYQAYSGRYKIFQPNVGVAESRPIACGRDENETRYIIDGSRWRTTNVTYKIVSYPHRTAILGGYAVIDKEFQKAFSLWESVSELNFTRREDLSDPDINIYFSCGYHRFARCFRVGHGCYTATPGDIIFNDDTEWTIGATSGSDIFQITVHNIGHTLGLGDNQRNGSVMCYGVCNNHVYRSNFTLHSDDIEAINILYGKNSFTKHRKQEQQQQEQQEQQQHEQQEQQQHEQQEQQQHEQQKHTLLELPITWAAIVMACIIIGVIVAVGVIKIIRCRKQASERYWTQVEFGVSLK